MWTVGVCCLVHGVCLRQEFDSVRKTGAGGKSGGSSKLSGFVIAARERVPATTRLTLVGSVSSIAGGIRLKGKKGG